MCVVIVVAVAVAVVMLVVMVVVMVVVVVMVQLALPVALPAPCVPLMAKAQGVACIDVVIVFSERTLSYHTRSADAVRRTDNRRCLPTTDRQAQDSCGRVSLLIDLIIACVGPLTRFSRVG